MIALPPIGRLGAQPWRVLIDLREAETGWTLIGGQMVLLLGLEHDAVPPRISADLDVVVDIRVRPPRVPRLVSWLEQRDFELGEPDPDGYAHRFTRDSVSIDLLAADGAGRRANRHTSASTVTVAVSGGTYALTRSRDLDVSAGDRSGCVPCPDLLGALVVKSRAARVDRRRGPDRHLRDLAFLYSLVADPIATRAELGPANCGRLRAVAALDDEDHDAWVALGRNAADAVAARSIIIARAP